MDNFKDMEPGIKDTAAFDSTNKESKKKESRPVISAKAQTILEFLRNCTPYEADSERAQKLMEAVKGFVDISQLCRISVALMKISSDFKAVEDARGHLQSQSVANGNRN